MAVVVSKVACKVVAVAFCFGNVVARKSGAKYIFCCQYTYKSPLVVCYANNFKTANIK